MQATTRLTIAALFFFIFSLTTQAQEGCYIQGEEYIYCPQFEIPYQVVCRDSSIVFVEIWDIIGPAADLHSAQDQDNFVLVNFYETGIYTLTALVYDAQGNSYTLSYDIYVDGGAKIEIDGCYEDIDNCIAVCEGSSNVFRIADSTGMTANFLVTGAENVTLLWDRVEIEWGGPGMGSVQVEGACGQDYYCVRILAEPTADFEVERYESLDTITVCKNELLQFKNLSENGLSYSWNFGDGNVSNDFEPTHRFDASGTYSVSLNAFGVCTCMGEKEIIVQVLEAAAPVLDCISTVCPETRQVYTAMTDGCNEFNWQISSNGTIIQGGESDDDFIEVIWHSGPDGIIELSVSDCNSPYCSSVAQFRVPVITTDGPLEGDLSVCSGELVRYTLPDFPGSEYNWSLSGNGVIVGDADRNTIAILWDEVSSVTTANLEVSYDHCFLGCGGTDQITVSITPTVNLNADQQVCQGELATARAVSGFSSTTPVTVDWELQDEEGNVIFSQAGSPDFSPMFNIPAGVYYWVAYNDNPDYCNETTKATIQVTETPASPQGIEGETEICSNIEYGYTVIRGGNYSTEWVVTDGSGTFNYSGSNIRHTFGINPPYSIEVYHLDIQNASCRSTSYTLPITNGIANDIVGKDSVCHESIEMYTMTAVNGAQYEWSIVPDDMGELLKSNASEIEVFWTKPGDATLVLNACGRVIQKEIYIKANPVFNVMGNLSSCGNVRTTISTDQALLQHIWRDENEAVLSSNNTADLLPGYYSVELIDELGCSSKESFEITALPYPQVNLTSPTPFIDCSRVSQGVRLVSNTDGVDYTFNWYQDGVLVGSGPEYIATSIARYNVEATNEYGCTASSRILDLEDLCQPDTSSGSGPICVYLDHGYDFNVVENSCSSKEYSIQGTSIVPGTGKWHIRSISDAHVASFNGDVFTHDYRLPGYYGITFTAELDPFNYIDSLCGHRDYFVDSVLLVADFENTEACVSVLIEFNDLSTTLPGHQINSWQWDFGDPASGANNTSSDQNPMHQFDAAGDYAVTLTTTTTTGCISQITRIVRVHDGPELQVIYDPLSCEKTATRFEISEDIFDINWDFGDPGSSENSASKKSVLHEYEFPNQYNVAVTAANIYGCISTETVVIDIQANTLSGDITASPGFELCEGNTIQLNAPSNGDEWLWSTGESTENIRVTTTNQYSVFITDENNCQYEPPSAFVNILPKPVVMVRGRLIFADGSTGPWRESLALCEGEAFELQVFSESGLSYDWNNNETTQSLIFDGVGLDLPSPGIQDYSVVASNPSTLCESDPFVFTVEIYEMPSSPQIIASSGSLCAYDLNVLEVIGPDPLLEYIWSNGEIGHSITVSEADRYFVYAVNDNGCRMLSNEIEIIPAAPVDRIPSGCFDLCDPYELCLPSMGVISEYNIYRDGILVETGNTWPSDYLIEEDGSYTFEVSTPNGCTVISEPLDIRLYQGLGVITTEVYADVDGNGIISASDTLLTGIDVDMLSSSPLSERGAETRFPGSFDFVDLPVNTYLGRIDGDLLHPRWHILIDSVEASLTSCGDSTVIQLLLGENCVVTGPEIDLEVCEGEEFSFGDSTWISPGQFEHHYLSASGCDSLVVVELLAPDSLQLIIQTWYDVDGDGTVSSSDTLVPEISFNINNLGGGLLDALMTGTSGLLELDYLRGEYTISLESTLLPSGYEALIDNIAVSSDDCGSVNINFLLGPGCVDENILESVSVCEGDSVQLYGYWFTEPGIDSVLIVGGCDTLLIVELVWVNSTLSVQAAVDHACVNSGFLGSISLDVVGTGPFSYTWEPNVGTSNLVEDLTPGDYSVTISDAYHCQWVEEFTIIQADTLTFDIDPLYEVEENTSEQMIITGDIGAPNLQVEWTPADFLDCSNCFSPNVTPLSSQDYNITIWDENGCPYYLSTRVELIPAQDSLTNEVFSPSVFTPNNDNWNDRFKLYSKDETRVISFTVFNRWGDKVYEERNVMIDQMQGWDGTFQGIELNDNVFVYQVQLETMDGEKFDQYGDITLIK